MFYIHLDFEAPGYEANLDLYLEANFINRTKFFAHNFLAVDSFHCSEVQYYHVGLSMFIFGNCIRRSRFCVSLVLLPGL